MKSKNNLELKLKKNPCPIQKGGAINSSNDKIILQNSYEKDQKKEGNQVTVFHNNINNIYNNINENNLYNNEININNNHIQELNNIQSSNKDNENKKKSNSFFYIHYNIASKFLMKVYGIVLFQFIIIFALVLIFQIETIRDYLHDEEPLFYTFLGISFLAMIFPAIIFECCPNILRKVPNNYIILFTFTLFLAIFFAFIGSFFHFQIILGVITCIIAISIGSFCIGLFNKGNDPKVWYFILSSVICLIIHYGILALIFRDYYFIFIIDTAYVILYSIVIAYDTITIKKKFSCDDYIVAAIILDIDIIRLFISLLRLFGFKRK